MLKLHDLKPNVGSRKEKIRRGRGDASGKGSFCGRGCKGQKARTGGGVRPGFEGGQTPLLQRMPKRRGFKNPSNKTYAPVNLGVIEAHFSEKETVSPETLLQKKLIRKNMPLVKILAQGDFSKKLIFAGVAYSETAKKKIEKAGGTLPELKK